MTYKLDQIRVLVVDDMKPMLDLTKAVLGIFGFKTVYLCDNGADAFDMVRDKDPEIVITDWLMDPIDGLELTRMIRNSKKIPNPYVPIIMMSGFSSRIRVEEARDAGITEFLVKPFTSTDLYSRIHHIIERPRQFVATDMFFGPDRRRKKAEDYIGPKRRDEDESLKNPPSEGDMGMLKKLLDDVKEF